MQAPSGISLLVPQDSRGLLGHALIHCQPSEVATSLTCGAVLAVISQFYQQKVLLQEQDGCMEATSSGNSRQLQEQQQQGRILHRFELLGTRLLFEGLLRATTDPHSSLYEVILA